MRRLTIRGCAPSPMTRSLPSGCTHSGQAFRLAIGIQKAIDSFAASSLNLRINVPKSKRVSVSGAYHSRKKRTGLQRICVVKYCQHLFPVRHPSSLRTAIFSPGSKDEQFKPGLSRLWCFLKIVKV